MRRSLKFIGPVIKLSLCLVALANSSPSLAADQPRIGNFKSVKECVDHVTGLSKREIAERMPRLSCTRREALGDFDNEKQLHDCRAELERLAKQDAERFCADYFDPRVVGSSSDRATNENESLSTAE